MRRETAVGGVGRAHAHPRRAPHHRLCIASKLGHDGGAMPGRISGTDRALTAGSACRLAASPAPRGSHDPDRIAGRPAPLLPTPPARRSARRGRPPLGRLDLVSGPIPPDTYFHNCAPSLDGCSVLVCLWSGNVLASPTWRPTLTQTPRLPLGRCSTPAIGSREQPRDAWMHLRVRSCERLMPRSPHTPPVAGNGARLRHRDHRLARPGTARRPSSQCLSRPTTAPSHSRP